MATPQELQRQLAVAQSNLQDAAVPATMPLLALALAQQCIATQTP